MLKTFPLNSRAKTTALKQPKELFSFARDEQGEYVLDEVKEKYLSYYYFPDSYVEKQIDLAAGFSQFKKIPEEDNLGDFDAYLRAIMNYERQENENKKLNVDIVTFRGLMTKILALPYNLKDPIDLNIVAFDGQLFIKADEEIELRRRQQQQQSQSGDLQQYDYSRRCEYSGYKFETIATLPKPWAECSRQMIESRTKKQVSNYQQYLSVVKTGIGKVKLLVAGEVDCLWDYIPEDNKDILPHYVELKTSRALENPSHIVNFQKKLFKTWAQSFLLGVRKIIYGFRDDNLILRSVEIYQTDEIPILIKDNPVKEQDKHESINCMNALKWYGAVIEWIQQSVPIDDESKAYRLSYDPGSRSFALHELLTDENKRLRNGGILTQEFKDWRNAIKS